MNNLNLNNKENVAGQDQIGGSKAAATTPAPTAALSFRERLEQQLKKAKDLQKQAQQDLEITKKDSASKSDVPSSVSSTAPSTTFTSFPRYSTLQRETTTSSLSSIPPPSSLVKSESEQKFSSISDRLGKLRESLLPQMSSSAIRPPTSSLYSSTLASLKESKSEIKPSSSITDTMSSSFMRQIKPPQINQPQQVSNPDNSDLIIDEEKSTLKPKQPELDMCIEIETNQKDIITLSNTPNIQKSDTKTNQASIIEPAMTSSQKSLFKDNEKNLDSKILSNSATKYSSNIDSKIITSLDSKITSNLDSKIGTNLENKNISSLYSKYSSNFDSKIGSNLDSKIGSNFDNKISYNFDSKIGFNQNSKIVNQDSQNSGSKINSNLESKIQSNQDSKIGTNFETKNISSTISQRLEEIRNGSFLRNNLSSSYLGRNSSLSSSNGDQYQEQPQSRPYLLGQSSLLRQSSEIKDNSRFSSLISTASSLKSSLQLPTSNLTTLQDKLNKDIVLSAQKPIAQIPPIIQETNKLSSDSAIKTDTASILKIIDNLPSSSSESDISSQNSQQNDNKTTIEQPVSQQIKFIDQLEKKDIQVNPIVQEKVEQQQNKEENTIQTEQIQIEKKEIESNKDNVQHLEIKNVQEQVETIKNDIIIEEKPVDNNKMIPEETQETKQQSVQESKIIEESSIHVEKMNIEEKEENNTKQQNNENIINEENTKMQEEVQETKENNDSVQINNKTNNLNEEIKQDENNVVDTNIEMEIEEHQVSENTVEQQKDNEKNNSEIPVVQNNTEEKQDELVKEEKQNIQKEVNTKEIEQIQINNNSNIQVEEEIQTKEVEQIKESEQIQVVQDSIQNNSPQKDILPKQDDQSIEQPCTISEKKDDIDQISKIQEESQIVQETKEVEQNSQVQETKEVLEKQLNSINEENNSQDSQEKLIEETINKNEEDNQITIPSNQITFVSQNQEIISQKESQNQEIKLDEIKPQQNKSEEQVQQEDKIEQVESLPSCIQFTQNTIINQTEIDEDNSNKQIEIKNTEDQNQAGNEQIIEVQKEQEQIENQTVNETSMNIENHQIIEQQEQQIKEQVEEVVVEKTINSNKSSLSKEQNYQSIISIIEQSELIDEEESDSQDNNIQTDSNKPQEIPLIEEQNIIEENQQVISNEIKEVINVLPIPNEVISDKLDIIQEQQNIQQISVDSHSENQELNLKDKTEQEKNEINIINEKENIVEESVVIEQQNVEVINHIEEQQKIIVNHEITFIQQSNTLMDEKSSLTSQLNLNQSEEIKQQGEIIQQEDKIEQEEKILEENIEQQQDDKVEQQEEKVQQQVENIVQEENIDQNQEVVIQNIENNKEINENTKENKENIQQIEDNIIVNSNENKEYIEENVIQEQEIVDKQNDNILTQDTTKDIIESQQQEQENKEIISQEQNINQEKQSVETNQNQIIENNNQVQQQQVEQDNQNNNSNVNQDNIDSSIESQQTLIVSPNKENNTSQISSNEDKQQEDQQEQQQQNDQIQFIQQEQSIHLDNVINESNVEMKSSQIENTQIEVEEDQSLNTVKNNNHEIQEIKEDKPQENIQEESQQIVEEHVKDNDYNKNIQENNNESSMEIEEDIPQIQENEDQNNLKENENKQVSLDNQQLNSQIVEVNENNQEDEQIDSQQTLEDQSQQQESEQNIENDNQKEIIIQDQNNNINQSQLDQINQNQIQEITEVQNEQVSQDQNDQVNKDEKDQINQDDSNLDKSIIEEQNVNYEQKQDKNQEKEQSNQKNNEKQSSQISINPITNTSANEKLIKSDLKLEDVPLIGSLTGDMDNYLKKKGFSDIKKSNSSPISNKLYKSNIETIMSSSKINSSTNQDIYLKREELSQQQLSNENDDDHSFITKQVQIQPNTFSSQKKSMDQFNDLMNGNSNLLSQMNQLLSAKSRKSEAQSNIQENLNNLKNDSASTINTGKRNLDQSVNPNENIFEKIKRESDKKAKEMNQSDQNSLHCTNIFTPSNAKLISECGANQTQFSNDSFGITPKKINFLISKLEDENISEGQSKIKSNNVTINSNDKKKQNQSEETNEQEKQQNSGSNQGSFISNKSNNGNKGGSAELKLRTPFNTQAVQQMEIEIEKKQTTKAPSSYTVVSNRTNVLKSPVNTLNNKNTKTNIRDRSNSKSPARQTQVNQKPTSNKIIERQRSKSPRNNSTNKSALRDDVSISSVNMSRFDLENEENDKQYTQYNSDESQKKINIPTDLAKIAQTLGITKHNRNQCQLIDQIFNQNQNTCKFMLNQSGKNILYQTLALLEDSLPNHFIIVVTNQFMTLRQKMNKSVSWACINSMMGVETLVQVQNLLMERKIKLLFIQQEYLLQEQFRFMKDQIKMIFYEDSIDKIQDINKIYNIKRYNLFNTTGFKTLEQVTSLCEKLTLKNLDENINLYGFDFTNIHWTFESDKEKSFINFIRKNNLKKVIMFIDKSKKIDELVSSFNQKGLKMQAYNSSRVDSIQQNLMKDQFEILCCYNGQYIPRQIKQLVQYYIHYHMPRSIVSYLNDMNGFQYYHINKGILYEKFACGFLTELDFFEIRSAMVQDLTEKKLIEIVLRTLNHNGSDSQNQNKKKAAVTQSFGMSDDFFFNVVLDETEIKIQEHYNNLMKEDEGYSKEQNKEDNIKQVQINKFINENCIKRELLIKILSYIAADQVQIMPYQGQIKVIQKNMLLNNKIINAILKNNQNKTTITFSILEIAAELSMTSQELNRSLKKLNADKKLQYEVKEELALLTIKPNIEQIFDKLFEEIRFQEEKQINDLDTMYLSAKITCNLTLEQVFKYQKYKDMNKNSNISEEGILTLKTILEKYLNEVKGASMCEIFSPQEKSSLPFISLKSQREKSNLLKDIQSLVPRITKSKLNLQEFQLNRDISLMDFESQSRFVSLIMQGIDGKNINEFKPALQFKKYFKYDYFDILQISFEYLQTYFTQLLQSETSKKIKI